MKDSMIRRASNTRVIFGLAEVPDQMSITVTRPEAVRIIKSYGLQLGFENANEIGYVTTFDIPNTNGKYDLVIWLKT